MRAKKKLFLAFVVAITGGPFRPSPSVPALQYVAIVESGSAAAEAGLQPGDFIIEVREFLTFVFL